VKFQHGVPESAEINCICLDLIGQVSDWVSVSKLGQVRPAGNRCGLALLIDQPLPGELPALSVASLRPQRRLISKAGLWPPEVIYADGIYQARNLIMETAKIFWSGRSQAVRLPKEFRFDTDEVRIRRHGSGVILEPIARDWAWLDEIIGPVDDDFAGGVSEQPSEQERPVLDYFK
jgi:antitoxin VapB